MEGGQRESRDAVQKRRRRQWTRLTALVQRRIGRDWGQHRTSHCRPRTKAAAQMTDSTVHRIGRWIADHDPTGRTTSGRRFGDW